MAETATPAALEPRLEAIYQEHHGFVWSSLARLCVPSAALDDACQDVFLIVFRRLSDFEGRSQLRTWLFSIARRVAFRYRRGMRRADRKARALARERPHVVSVDELLERKRAATLVLHALDDLDDDKRTAVVLHVLEGLSGPQIAAMLNVPVDTAYSRIKAGRRVLRTRLRALGVEDDARVYEAARRQTQPSDDARRRVAALLAVRLTAAPVAVAGSWTGIAAAVVLVVAGLLGARTLSSREPSPAGVVTVETSARPSVEERVAAPPEVVAAPEAPAPAVEPTPATSPRPRVQPRATASAAPRDLLREEVVLIGAVRRALDTGRPADAVPPLDRHAREFPQGELALERRAYRAIALCELGQETQGRGAGRTFVKAHPNATLAGRVRAACALEEKRARG